MSNPTARTLKTGTKLPHNYIIERVIGEGGFGVTYAGHLEQDNKTVAIKEYFPSNISYRTSNQINSCSILPYTGQEQLFYDGMQRFLKEGSILKEFQELQNIVSIIDIIQANNTSYLVMEYIDGITLKQYITENGTLSFDDFFPLITPIIHALIQIHRKGLLHRDISPENIMVGTDNQLHLIDFGAAHFETAYKTQTMTVILKSGFAPPEQYLRDSNQGSFTDVYALSATMYMVLTGFAPPESVRRMQHDDLQPLAPIADISSWQAAAIEKGLNLAPADRYPNLEAFYQALCISPIEMNTNRNKMLLNSIENNQTVYHRANKKRKVHNKVLLALVFILLFLVFGIVGTQYIRKTMKVSKGDLPIENGKSKEETFIPASSDITTTSTEEIPNISSTATEKPSKSTTEHTTTENMTQPTTQTTNKAEEETTSPTNENKNSFTVTPDEEDEYSTIKLK